MAVTTVRNTALNLTTDLAQAGAVFNDATRLLDGGLWDTPADSNNEVAYLGMYTTDIHAVLNDINGMLANPGAVTVGGAALNLAAADTSVLQQVQGQLQTLLTLANGSVGNDATAATNQELIHTTQTTVLDEINGDTNLADALTGATYVGKTGAANVGFQALPTGADDAASLAAASSPNATLAQIGTVFNAAVEMAVGGLNQSNLGQFDTDMKAIAAGLTNIVNNPSALSQIEQGLSGVDAATTTIHLDTVLEQVYSQINNFDTEYATNPNVAARSTNDNLLDIIQGDAALNAAAGGGGNPGNAGGFSEMPTFLAGTVTPFQDNQAQTNFWAKFLAEANVINNQLDNVAAGNNTTPGELQALITEIQNYQQYGAAFDHSQGGIFGARFDNELLGGTLNVDTANAIHGLQGILNGDAGAALAADQAQIQAAGQGFAADAQDVSGNNIPLGGGTYVGDATTVASATSVAGIAHGSMPVAGADSAVVDSGGGSQGGNGGQGNSSSVGQGTGDGGQVAQGSGGNTGGQVGGQVADGGHGNHSAAGQSAGDGGQVAQANGGQGANGGHGNQVATGQSAGNDHGGQVAQGAGQGDNGGHGNQAAAGQSVQAAQGTGSHDGGQGDACHGCGGNSADHGNHSGQQIASFWNDADDHGHNFHHQFELMWHHG